MKTLFAIAIAAAAAMLPAGAYPAPGDADCLINLDANGKEYCMTDAEEKSMQYSWKPGYKNCMREYADAKRLGGWYGNPSQAACIAWAEAVKQKGTDMIDKGLKELMEAK